MPNYNDFGERLGNAIGSGLQNIGNKISRRYEMEWQNAQKKADQKREEFTHLRDLYMNQGASPQLARKAALMGPDYMQTLTNSQAPKTQEESTLVNEWTNFENMRKERMSTGMRKDTAQAASAEGQAAWYQNLAGGQPGVLKTAIDPVTGNPISYFPSGTPGGRPVVLPANPVAINPETGEQKTLPRGGKIVSSAGATQAKQTLSKITGFSDAIDELENILTGVPSGRFLGGGAKILNTVFGAFPDVKTARSLGGMLVPMATRIIGGDVGNLSETEQKAASRALELANGTEEERRQALQLLRGLLATKKQEAESLVQGSEKFWGEGSKQKSFPSTTLPQSANGIERRVNGKIAIFDAATKKFIRYK